ncbi:MAG: LysR family transcriptional regulator [Robiginitomaculum sp.]|nr:LysR family transcriptional regulator [Robiginitomaculum sp.]
MAGIEKISRLVSWDDFSVFLAISKTGSISKAAVLLGRTQPTISKRIDNLEARLGIQLFKRTPSGMTATEIGKAMLSHASAMNRSATSIERMASSLDKSGTGDVLVRCLDGLVADWIMPNLAAFQAENEGLNLSFYTQNTAVIDSDHEPDLAVQFNTTKPMEFVAQRLGSLHYVPMVSRSYKEKNGIPRTMEDAVNYHLLYLRRSGLVVEKWEKKSRALRELATPSLSANSCSVILSAVLNGAGVSMLPTYMAKLYPDLLVLDYGIIYTYNFWLVRAPHTTQLSRVNTTADWLLDTFSPADQPWFDQDYIRPSEFSDIEIIMPH